ncbi:ParB/RepB/Spo0J family partition protein [Williamsia herbipolensis]|uniref:ParB/RepB/Spo0J family partition protein n=1 Tax=Williamsia herbipolensis TaxID=1603258 RepID=A0AAU4JZ20_9NOCA|nr:ParB/RepB/Spo0J family partition protein [Williamsia herbipolensis]
MAGRGGRVDLADLAGSVGDTSTVDAPTNSDGVFRANVPLGQLVANPRNPRAEVGNLEDLATIVDRQLQPGTVVSRAAWLALWPDASQLGAARWVVVNGCRRLAACHHYRRAGMDVVIRDSIAGSKDTVLWAAIVENIDRQDFDVLEEANAVELLVTETGSATAAAQRLGRSPGWISQRRALLKLAPGLQQALRKGELAVRLARSLAQVPLAQQVDAWRKAQDRRGVDREVPGAADVATEPVTPATVMSRAFRKVKAQPTDLVVAVCENYDETQINELIVLLSRNRRLTPKT